MFLQYEKDRSDAEMCQKFYRALQREDVVGVKASDFKKKTLRSRKSMDKKHDFASRRHKQADKSVMSGDYAKAMQSLLRVNSKVNLDAIEKTIRDSLPARSYDELSDNQRRLLFTYAHSSNDDYSLTVKDVLYQLRSCKKNRSPGIDGVTVERLSSVFLGGSADEACKRESLNDYVQLLNKRLKPDLTDAQKKTVKRKRNGYLAQLFWICLAAAFCFRVCSPGSRPDNG